jgi:hypothetical protein
LPVGRHKPSKGLDFVAGTPQRWAGENGKRTRRPTSAPDARSSRL